jgi:membrane dipeptidase
MKNKAPNHKPSGQTRRDVLKSGAAIAALAAMSRPGRSFAADGDGEIVMDGHVHVVNRIYWEGIDPWTPQQQGWDYARARSAGINWTITSAPMATGTTITRPSRRCG